MLDIGPTTLPTPTRMLLLDPIWTEFSATRVTLLCTDTRCCSVLPPESFFVPVCATGLARPIYPPVALSIPGVRLGNGPAQLLSKKHEEFLRRVLREDDASHHMSTYPFRLPPESAGTGHELGEGNLAVSICHVDPHGTLRPVL